MTFTLGQRSMTQLDGVQPKLRAVVLKAIQITRQDFLVVQGLRTAAEAAANSASGASRTTHSLHLKQPDGYAHAVDLAAWQDGKLSYDTHLFWPIISAVREAAQNLGTTIRWGGTWSILNDIKGDPEAACVAYSAAFRKANPGRQPLLDIGHVEIPNPQRG